MATATATEPAAASSTATTQVTAIPTDTATALAGSQTPTATATVCAVQFSDVPATAYFYTPVTYLACHGVISGYADGTFRPYNNTTRGQMVKIVTLGFAIPGYIPPGGDNTFADVPPQYVFFGVIETAAHNNIVSGYACGGPGEACDSRNRPFFRPVNNVTRGQLSKIVAVAAGWVLVNPPNQTFEDVFPNTAFYPFVETAACHGVVSGYNCGSPGETCDGQNRPYFRQGNNATRGQIAKIVYISITAGAACTAPGSTATPLGSLSPTQRPVFATATALATVLRTPPATATATATR